MTSQKINRISLGLLIVGFGAALIIFLTATPDVDDPVLGDPLGDKRYLASMQKIGGSANVAMAQFQDWFAGLWHGPALAVTISVITVLIILIFRFIAARPGFMNVLLAKDE